MKCDGGSKRSKLCWTLSGAPDPKECLWRGSAPICNRHYQDDEVMIMMNRWGDGKYCDDGNKAYCCKSPLAKENSCYWAGVAASCNGDDLPLTFSDTVLSILDDVAKVILRVIGRAYPLTALVGEALLLVLDELDLDTDKRYCCPKGDVDKWKNCDWFGKPGSCFDGHCPDMTYVQLTDSYFGGGETCGIRMSWVRTFCRESKNDPLFLPVLLGNLFQHPPEGDSVDTDFSLETDKDSDSQQNPSDAAFQFVVLASPEELQVSLDKRDGSHWDVYGCLDGETEGEHTMPAGYEPGKYAVAKEMVPSESSRVLPRYLYKALKPFTVRLALGFTLTVTKLSLPLDLSQSYLTFYDKGEITGVLTLEAVAKVFYEKSDVVVNTPFPGASFKIPGIATIVPQLTVEGSIDASLALAGKIEIRLEFAKWEVCQVVLDNNDDRYKPKEIAEDDPDFDQNGDMDGLKEPAFYAGLQASGDVTARISAAAEFGVRFDKRWEVDPAAVAVVGEASVMPGAEHDITPKYNEPIVDGGTYPDLGPIPSGKRDLSAVGSALGYASSMSSPEPALLRGRSLSKRAAVWGPAISVPVGSYFCPSSTDDSENSGSPCSQIVPAFDEDGWNTNGDDYNGLRRWWELSEASSPLDTQNSTAKPAELEPRSSRLDKRDKKYTQLCEIDISIQYPRNGDERVVTNPATQYDAEHVLEFQLIKWFFLDLDIELPEVPHPDPSRPGMLGFCQLVREQWGIDGFEIQGLETGKGTGVKLTPADHVAQQFPTTTWNRDEYVVLEHKINTPAKGKAWGKNTRRPEQDLEIVDTNNWMAKLTRQAEVDKMLKSMRYLIGSRMYHNDVHIRDILRRQRDQVGNVLELLDTQYLPARPKQAAPYRPWVPLGLKARWNEFTTGKFFVVQTKTMKVLNEWMPRIQEQWASDAKRQEAKTTDGDSDADKRRKEQLQTLIDNRRDLLYTEGVACVAETVLDSSTR
ncbi:hypothetical protein RB595_008033 [Gaeumannomyces hyphopodioides]